MKVIIEKTQATDKAQNNSFVYTVTHHYLKHLDQSYLIQELPNWLFLTNDRILKKMLSLLMLLSIAESVFKVAYIQSSYKNEIQEESSSGLPRQVINQSNKV